MIIQFDGFRFDSERGELVRTNADGLPQSHRLAPQPCTLLLLLIDNYPNVVSREEIKEALWPEVHRGFEKSLHYCVRQVRAALEDEATAPRYIETVPKRGYRWMVPVNIQNNPDPVGQSSTMKSSRLWLLGLILIVMIGSFFLGKTLYSGNNLKADSSKPRIAVMSFQPSAAGHPFAGNDIALQLVDQLTNQDRLHLEIIGPTTTNAYPPDQLATLIDTYKIDWLLNGRYSKDQAEPRLLAEIIRAGDGAHVWVQYFAAGTSSDSIVANIRNGFFETWQQQQ